MIDRDDAARRSPTDEEAAPRAEIAAAEQRVQRQRAEGDERQHPGLADDARRALLGDRYRKGAM